MSVEGGSSWASEGGEELVGPLHQLSLCSETAGFCLNIMTSRGFQDGAGRGLGSSQFDSARSPGLEPEKGKGSRRDTGTCDPSVSGPGLALGV